MKNENAGDGSAKQQSEDQQDGGTPPAGQQPVPRKRRRKGLVIGLSAGGLAVAVAALLVALSMTVWSELDRGDYELAARFTDTTTDFFEIIVMDMDTALLATRDGKSAEEVEEAVAAVRDSETYFDDHLDKLSELPAVTDDPEIAELFEEYKTAYGTNRDSLMEGVEAAMPFGEYHRACHGNQSEPISQMRLGMSSADLDRIMEEYDQSQVACTEELQKVAKGDFKWFHEPAEALLEKWQPLRDANEKIGQAAITNDQADMQAAQEALQTARDDYAAAQSELDGSFSDLSDDVRGHDSSDELLDALEKKVEQFES